MAPEKTLSDVLEETFRALSQAAEHTEPGLEVTDVGTVDFVGSGTVRVTGLSGVRSRELIRFSGDLYGWAMNVDPGETGVVLLDESEKLSSGDRAERTERVLDTIVGDEVVGRMVDPRGRVLDDGPPLSGASRKPVERDAPEIMDRAPVNVPLQTGLKVIDALIPIGRGQRELILGDRQTGKTAIAVDAILNQRKGGVACIYCAVGKRGSAVAKAAADLEKGGAMEYTTLVVTTEDDPPGLQFMAPYAAMTMAEHFMEQGKDALVVFDDLTRHARAYREVSLLLRRPPGREAYPGDIFYVHSRLLERSTHLREELGGGSVTALPIIETEAQNLSAYIPTNLISITDGQVYLSPDLFQKGVLPAVDVGKSVSRVGGKTQLKAYRSVAGDLRLTYSQFEELETFARFGTRLDEETKKTLDRGRRVREILKQDQYATLDPFEQVIQLVAVNRDVLDGVDYDDIVDVAAKVASRVAERLADLGDKVRRGEELSDEDVETIREAAAEEVEEIHNHREES